MVEPLSVDVIVADAQWSTLVADLETIVVAAAQAAWRESPLRPGPLPQAGCLVTILLENDVTIQELNRQFRNQDKPTNVLSFVGEGAAMVPEEPWLLGDIVIAQEVTAAEAAAENKSVSDHLRHLTVHGMLHLLGYDHETDADAQEMESLEIQILAQMGVRDPYVFQDSAP
ncbi:MAG: rRNA maturation RNase YbeY [Magnetospiraceae bacterium]